MPFKSPWLRRPIKLAMFAVFSLLLALMFAVGGLLYGLTSMARSLPDLSGWHTDAPESEFHERDEKKDYTFDDYLAQEDEVFKELADLITNEWSAEHLGLFCRFRTDSVCNPETLFERNWNRTYVLESDQPVGGALLVHGLSDSPYSLRTLGARLHAEGYTVIGLRVPGHGTCPKALAEAKWEDWAAAMRVAVRGLRAKLPDDAPLVLAGFSNGGAISLDYVISTVEDDTLPRPDAVVLFSPMIGISQLAWLTKLHSVITWMSGEEKAAWMGISAEIDPFKYSSWPMNASVQAWQMTQRLEQRLSELSAEGRLDKLPPVLTHQSAVDATIMVKDLITRLYARIDHPRNELVLYDINRVQGYENLVSHAFQDQIVPPLQREDLRFRLTVVTNVGPESLEVKTKTRQGKELTETPLGLAWPRDIFSLSHSALPVPSTDPVYGTADASKVKGLSLGSLNIRGEAGVLTIGESLMIRLRHNPFYNFQEDHVIAWLKTTLAKP